MRHSQGFTLFEVLIAMAIGVLLLGLVFSIYSLTVRSLNASQTRAELTQNSKIILERITRDLRQTRALATILPATAGDPLNPPPAVIEFLDGHNTTDYQYINYYLSGTDLRRQIKHYYFASDPAIFVPFDAEDDFGNPALININEDHLVGQYISNLKFYGTDLITSELTLLKSGITHATATAVFGRNL